MATAGAVGNFVHCRECGAQIARSAVACPACGGRQRTGSGKSKIAAGFIALFLGGIGIHRFYLGQWWGIFYLLFFWTFVPAIIAFVEAIVFFCTSDDVWDQKYG
jgi:TM2 domain-containing membrane protein YozV